MSKNEGAIVNPYKRMLLTRDTNIPTTSDPLEESTEKEEVIEEVAEETSDYKKGLSEEEKEDVDKVMTNVGIPVEDSFEMDYFKSATRKGVMDKYGSIVSDLLKGTGIHPETLFTQLFTETDIRRDGSQGNISAGIRKGFNPFNIKQYKGSDVANYYLHMDDESAPSKFIRYGSFQEGLQGYRDFLVRNPRYAEALKASTPEMQLQLIAQAGFATDPGYEDTLMSVLRGDILKQKFFRGGLIYLKNGQ